MNVSITTNVNFGGSTGTFSRSLTVDAVGNNVPNEVAPVAIAGTLSTRTTAASGVFTSTLHGIAQGEVVSIFWGSSYRCDVDVDLSDDNTITFSGGSGDDLPTEGDSISVSVRLQIDTPLAGTNLEALCVGGSQDIIFSVLNDAEASVLNQSVDSGDAYLWNTGSGNNPLSGNTIEVINFYNRSASTTSTVFARYAVDNTLDQV